MSARTAIATETASLDISASQPSAPQLPETPPKLSAEQNILNRFLAMACDYRTEGSIFNAMELFWRLVEDYPDTQQAEESKNALLEIAMQYERDGLRHPAYAIYERLL